MSDSVIKSVRRVFEILELFDQERRPLPAKEVSKRLNYPLMSTHALLKSMHQMGYADFDQPTWSYTPSRNFITVLAWAKEFLDRDENVLKLVEELNIETRETINLSQQMDANVKIIHGLEGDYPIGVNVKVGTLMPLTQSLTGLTALCALPDNEQGEVKKRINSVNPELLGAKEDELITAVKQELSEQATVAGYDYFVRGIAAVCMPIRSTVSGGAMVIGVVGPSDRIRANEVKHRKALVRLAKKHGVPISRAKKARRMQTEKQL